MVKRDFIVSPRRETPWFRIVCGLLMAGLLAVGVRYGPHAYDYASHWVQQQQQEKHEAVAERVEQSQSSVATGQQFDTDAISSAVYEVSDVMAGLVCIVMVPLAFVVVSHAVRP